MQNLYDAAAAAAGDMAPDFFDLYGQEISDPKLLRQHPDVPHRLFTPLLEKRNEAGLRWVADVLRANPELCRKHFDSDTVEDFKGRIRRQISDGEELREEVSNQIGEIARALGIRRAPRPRERNSEGPSSEPEGE